MKRGIVYIEKDKKLKPTIDGARLLLLVRVRLRAKGIPSLLRSVFFVFLSRLVTRYRRYLRDAV